MYIKHISSKKFIGHKHGFLYIEQRVNLKYCYVTKKLFNTPTRSALFAHANIVFKLQTDNSSKLCIQIIAEIMKLYCLYIPKLMVAFYNENNNRVNVQFTYNIL